ncbi:MAG: acetyl-CoA carboxylase biotin carboxyl carrier protein [Bacteriovoracaceae bacterium]
MNIETLKEIVKLAKDEGVAELTVESSNFKVSVNFSTGVVAPIQHVQPIIHQAAPAHQAPAKAAATDIGLHVIKSPFVGTFYSSPSPGKPVYVKVGDKVKVGQTLCVLEAMKIMNEIDADVAGEVIEICLENESLVEFGQPLFKIKPN